MYTIQYPGSGLTLVQIANSQSFVRSQEPIREGIALVTMLLSTILRTNPFLLTFYSRSDGLVTIRLPLIAT